MWRREPQSQRLGRDVGWLPSQRHKLSPVVTNAGNLDLAPAIEVSPEQPHPLAFTTEAEIRRSIETRIAAFDFEGLAQRAVQEGIERARGRV